MPETQTAEAFLQILKACLNCSQAILPLWTAAACLQNTQALICACVTQTLSTHVAVQLGKYLEARFGVASWTGFLLDRAVDRVSASEIDSTIALANPHHSLLKWPLHQDTPDKLCKSKMRRALL